jgi:hypothetical protein
MISSQMNGFGVSKFRIPELPPASSRMNLKKRAW